MQPIPRRTLLRAAGGAVLAAGAGGTAYAAVIEPGFRLVVREHRVSVPRWGDRPPLRICVTTDVHAGEPWMPLGRVGRIVDLANSLEPDLHVVLGDLPAHHRLVTGRVPMDAVTAELGRLRAPLGTWAVLGNHDWWDDQATQRDRRGPPSIRALLEARGIPVLANGVERLPHGAGLWLAGTDSALAFGRGRPGADDLPGTLSMLPDDGNPAILLAHEPDIFARLTGTRVGLVLSGHTHGGQVRAFGYSPMVPSRFGNRYALGLVREGGRNLVVSGGLGCSMLPVRMGVPPELTVIRLS